MNVLNLYFSSTGNTEKVALKIEETVQKLGHKVNTIKIAEKGTEMEILDYDFVFVGSGVYQQLPGKPLMELFRELLQAYVKKGEIKPGSPRRPNAKTVVYCTYGGAHTGINEAIPAVKYMGQLLDHLGYTIVGEWYVVGEYKPEKFRERSMDGRLGDIRGRPNEEDLRDVAEKVKGILHI
ncbi:MAG: flavodoxin [Deltaproteobacteria bacterium]|nr:MAG: flavodoxin [Deltaproteobacteria bacterium]